MALNGLNSLPAGNCKGVEMLCRIFYSRWPWSVECANIALP